MITADVRLDGNGGLIALKFAGHATGERVGDNLPCAAASVLVRTAFETLASREGMRVAGNAPSPGNLEFSVTAVPDACVEWSIGVTDNLLVGLSSLDREFPGQFEIRIYRNWRN